MHEIIFYNSLTRKKELFKPINDKKVGMYSCGPTVYNYAHIGNFRAYIFSDLVRRVLEDFGYEVKLTMNLTDVDDKTIKNSKENNISLNEYTKKYKNGVWTGKDYKEYAENGNLRFDFILGGLDEGSWITENFSTKFCMELVNNVVKPLHSSLEFLYFYRSKGNSSTFYGDKNCSSGRKCLSDISIKEVYDNCKRCSKKEICSVTIDF